MSLSEPLRKEISELVAQHRVVLFMKGTRSMPQCGFSAQVVKILDALLPSYETVDALHSPDIRDGIKAFSQWPTIPQLYVCLLYTSDAADDLLCVDLGGRRIIKKKKQ